MPCGPACSVAASWLPPGCTRNRGCGSMIRSTATHAALYSGHDPGVCCRYRAAPALWLLGYPDQALASSQAALALAQQLAHPSTLTLALYWAAVLHHLRREAP